MKIQVYSAITNNHDSARTDGVHTFTDHSHIGSPLAAARFYKTHPHLLFPEADWTIWLDGNVVLNVEPEELVSIVCQNPLYAPQCFGVFYHSHRESVTEEIDAVLAGGFDTPANIAKVLALYKLEDYPLSASLAMTMVLVRKNTCLNTELNERWWSFQCASSFRDQLTFPLCFPPPYWPTVDFTQPNQYFTRTA